MEKFYKIGQSFIFALSGTTLFRMFTSIESFLGREITIFESCCYFLIIFLTILLTVRGGLQIILIFSLGKIISLRKLKLLFPFVKKISIIGVSGVGKTTLISHLCRKTPSGKPTRGKPNAYIYNYSTRISKYAALLDTEGHSLAKQLDIALEADILIILLDHNMIFDEINIDNMRLQEHKNFLTRLVDRLDASNHKPSYIHILLNKKDLWSENDNFDEMLNFYDETVDDLKNEFKQTEIFHNRHSNNLSLDITKVLINVEKYLSK